MSDEEWQDEDGYPTDAALERIREWDLDDYRGLIAFVSELWWMPSFGWRVEDGELHLSTGGWSGNESLIDAMQANKHLFWTMLWVSSIRGGHYVFDLERLAQLEQSREKSA